MRTLIPIALTVTACTGRSEPEPEPLDLVDCMSVDPIEPLEGQVDQVVSQPIWLENGCEGRVRLEDLRWDDPREVFSVAERPDVWLLPGERLRFTLSYSAPRRGEFIGILGFVTSAGNVDLEVLGRTIGPDLTVRPARLELDPVLAGCTASGELRLENPGELPLTVQSAEVAEGWSVAAERDLPTAIDPGEALVLDVTIAPDRTGLAQAEVRIESAVGSQTVPVQAQVDTLYRGEASFKNYLPAKQDILIPMSRVGASKELAEAAIAHLPTAMARARNRGHDVRAAVVVGDRGCIVGPDAYVDTGFSQSEAREVFRTMADLDMRLAPYGSNEERPLMIAEAALSERNLGPDGCTSAFRRPDAQLQLVHVAQRSNSFASWSYYVDRFNETDASPYPVVHHAITEHPFASCDPASPSDIFDAARATGGLVRAPCEGVDLAIDDIFSATTSPPPRERRQTVFLEQEPIPTSLDVEVDGVAHSDWTWIPSELAIRFDDDRVPEGGTEVVVRYLPQPECD